MRRSILLTVAALLFPGAGSTARGQDVYHDNVVVVLDSSGSMSRPMRRTGTVKMDAAKAALKEVLKQVPVTTHIGLLVFSAANMRNDVAYPLGPRDDQALIRAIDLPQPGNGTPLGKYIKKGADMLLAERAKQFGYGSYKLLIVTDGEAEDKQLVDRYTPEVISRGIVVDVIGVDMKGNHTLATRASSYRRADDPESLKKAVAEIFAEVSSSGGNTAGEEAFEALAPLPVETAQAMIAALSVSGNQPIGGKSRKEPASSATPPPGKRVSTSSPQTPRHPPSPARDSGGRGMKVLLIIGVIVLILIVKAAMRGRRHA